MAAYAQVDLKERSIEQENSISDTDKSPMSTPSRPRKKLRNKPRMWLYLGTVLAIIALLISALYYANAQKMEQLPQPPAGGQNTQSGQQPAAQEPTTIQTEGVTLTFNVVKDPAGCV